MGAESVETTQKKFVSEFPPDNVYRGEIKPEEYLEKLLASPGKNGRAATVEELIIYLFAQCQSRGEPIGGTGGR